MPTGPRVRANNVYGTISDNPLLVGAVSFTSLGLSLLPAISAQHAVVVFDPKRVFGEPEIVVVTAHLALGTTATITRGQYGTVAREHPQGTAWAHVPIDEDWIEILTSGTRPGNPYEGQFIFETDTNKLYGYGGVDWAPRDAGGQLGYAQTATIQLGILAEVDLTDLSVAVTVGTGRRIKITGHVPQFSNTAGVSTFVQMSIFEGGTRLNLSTQAMADTYTGVDTVHVLTPSAGAHTYKLRAASDGTVQTESSALSPSFILVEDIGAA